MDWQPMKTVQSLNNTNNPITKSSGVQTEVLLKLKPEVQVQLQIVTFLEFLIVSIDLHNIVL